MKRKLLEERVGGFIVRGGDFHFACRIARQFGCMLLRAPHAATLESIFLIKGLIEGSDCS